MLAWSGHRGFKRRVNTVCSDTDDSNRLSEAWLDQFVDVIQPGMRALDLGCGFGEDSAELVSAGLDVIGIDASEERIAQARSLVPEAKFLLADFTEPFPFPNEFFDLVVASLSLHYFPWQTTIDIIGESARVLKPECYCVVRVNRVGDVHFGFGQGLEIEPDYFEVKPGLTKRFFSETSLAEALGTAFEVEMIEPVTITRWGNPKLALVAKARRR